MIRIHLLVGAMLVSLLGSAGYAQTVAIINARVISMGPEGDIRDGTVLVADGMIVALGEHVALPSGVRIIDAKGQFLTPGLILAPTPLALKDIIGNGGGRQSTDRLTAAYEVADDFNPRHPHVREARAEGVTLALVAPDAQRSGRLFAGQAALVQLGSSGEAVINARAAIYVSATESGSIEAGGGSGGLRVRLTRALDDARDYRRDPSHYDLARLEDLGLSRSDLVALGSIVEGKEPLLVEVDRAEEIRHILMFAKTQRIRVILSGASEGWLVADDIAKAGVPVVIDGEINQAESFDQLNASYENAALLTKAGVRVAFKPTFSRIEILDRSPRWSAGRAARFGLRLHDALAAITINPAQMFGVADRYGSIEIGKKADLVIWSGDPLETTTTARMVMIDGVEQSLTTRASMLRDRYLPSIMSAP